MNHSKYNDAGKKIKITRKIKTTLIKTRVNHAVAERKKWAKFGEETGNRPGPDLKTTQVGENIIVKLAIDWRSAMDKPADLAAATKPTKGKTLSCRICKGDHFTAKCPYKDAGLAPLDELSASINTSGRDTPDRPTETEYAGAVASGGTTGGSTTGRYVAPHLRAGGDKLRGSSSMLRERDDSATLRVTNISEDATDDDLRALFSRFGPLARIFLAKDRDTGMSKGYAFISYHEREHAARALDKMDKYGWETPSNLVD